MDATLQIGDEVRAIFGERLREVWTYRRAVRKQGPLVREQIDVLWSNRWCWSHGTMSGSDLRFAITSALNRLPTNQLSARLELGVEVAKQRTDASAWLRGVANLMSSMRPDQLAASLDLCRAALAGSPSPRTNRQRVWLARAS